MWVKGIFYIDGIELAYSAKVFEEPSPFGINGGTVSKLSVCLSWNCIPNWDHQLLGYDRGWYQEPTDDIAKKALEYLLRFFDGDEEE